MKIRRSSDNYLSRGGERIREGRKMGSARRPLILGLILVMVLGFAVYFRLWVIDYRVSSDEAELLRRQFDLANREAMDESAEWRLKYDGEKERADNCAQELSEIKQSFNQKTEDKPSINNRMEMLQKENMDLIERLESLKQELETEKLKCKS